MIVKLILGTKVDPGSKVIVESNIRFDRISEFEQWLKAQKVALDWLKVQKAAGR